MSDDDAYLREGMPDGLPECKGITEKQIDALCRLMAKKGMYRKHAALRVKVNPGTLSSWVDGDTPRRPDWRLKIDAARAEAAERWLDSMNKVREAGGDAKGMASIVRAAELMLPALDERFNATKQKLGNAINVIVLQGKPADVLPALEAVAVETDGVLVPPGARLTEGGGE